MLKKALDWTHRGWLEVSRTHRAKRVEFGKLPATRVASNSGLTEPHVRSFLKFFHFVHQFPRLTRKNGHPVLFAILEQDLFSSIKRAEITQMRLKNHHSKG
jgi:hypothetical protein